MAIKLTKDETELVKSQNVGRVAPVDEKGSRITFRYAMFWVAEK